jgi:beta-glucanase (GH16 family)
LIPLLLNGCGLAPEKPEWEIDGWELVWHDEFDGPAGTPPDPSVWIPEVGDGSDRGIPGWGNRELEYYTDSTENAAMDGAGNLVITAMAVDAGTNKLRCYYGACQYTSARLITGDNVEVTYGRVEARIRVPPGQGLWAAFWMLGSDLAEVGWPQSGEIDILEHIGKEPATVHGTVHGPGYSGENGIGQSYDLPEDQVFTDDFHVFAIEWEAQEIRWYVDGHHFNTVASGDLRPGANWVFDHPFFIILNVAVGGYWPGNPDESTIFPQSMYVDYVRVYQAAETAESLGHISTSN